MSLQSKNFILFLWISFLISNFINFPPIIFMKSLTSKTEAITPKTEAL